MLDEKMFNKILASKCAIQLSHMYSTCALDVERRCRQSLIGTTNCGVSPVEKQKFTMASIRPRAVGAPKRAPDWQGKSKQSCNLTWTSSSLYSLPLGPKCIVTHCRGSVAERLRFPSKCTKWKIVSSYINSLDIQSFSDFIKHVFLFYIDDP